MMRLPIILALLLVCLSTLCSGTENAQKHKGGQNTISHEKSLRKRQKHHVGNYAHIRGHYYPFPPEKELKKRYAEMQKKNKENKRTMTLHERYDEIAEMLATARTKALMGSKHEASVLLSDALIEYKLYKGAFKAKGLAVLSMEQSFAETSRTLGIKENTK